MNAPLRTTARDLASALMGKRRVAQSVHVSTKVFRDGRMARALVLVVPAGSETGDYYTIHSEQTLNALQAGASPEYLELEPSEPEDDAPEYPADDRACSAADRAYQIAQELS